MYNTTDSIALIRPRDGLVVGIASLEQLGRHRMVRQAKALSTNKIKAQKKKRFFFFLKERST